MRPRRPEPQSWLGLSDNQQRVIRWMVENDKDHKDAIKEKVVSHNTVFALWGVERIEKWKGFLHAHNLANMTADEKFEQDLLSLKGMAVRVMRDTLQAGEGNATAVRAAQWVLDGVLAARAAKTAPNAPTFAADSAQQELAAVLRLVR